MKIMIKLLHPISSIFTHICVIMFTVTQNPRYFTQNLAENPINPENVQLQKDQNPQHCWNIPS